MSQKFYKVSPDVPLEECLGKNSEAFAVGDPVGIDASGYAIYALATTKVIGFCVNAVTMAADNVTVAKVRVSYYPAVPGVQMQYTGSTACAQASVGTYADLSGTTGATTIALPGTTSGQFVILDFDPNRDGTTTEVIVETAEPKRLAFAQV